MLCCLGGLIVLGSSDVPDLASQIAETVDVHCHARHKLFVKTVYVKLCIVHQGYQTHSGFNCRSFTETEKHKVKQLMSGHMHREEENEKGMAERGNLLGKDQRHDFRIRMTQPKNAFLVTNDRRLKQSQKMKLIYFLL